MLINWGAEENADPYVQHLAKVWTILEYLDLLADTGKGSELVLIVDGFDVQFQLPPEVIISRYYSENELANKRIEKQLGIDVMTEHGFKQTVLFSHDKVCWPGDDRRPACWVVPESPFAKMAFGAYTDTGLEANRPRWLNSGTIMGPIDDVRDIFRATLDLIHKEHITDSDQFYFANVWSTQEYARRTLQPGEPFQGITKEDVEWPVIEPGQRTEYYLGLDYEGVLFQTMAFFREFITWMTFERRELKPDTWSVNNTQQHVLTDDWYYNAFLPEDIQRARGPFDALLPASNTKRDENEAKKAPSHLTWNDLSLGTNVISQTIFPLLHFTGQKHFRDLWWPRMWFVPYGEELLKAGVKRRMEEEKEYGKAMIASYEIGGSTWWHGEVVGKGVNETKMEWGEKGGAFSGNATFLGWDQLCVMHEKILFQQ